MTEQDPLRIVEARFVAGAATIEQMPPPTGVEIAFAGRSNVGKSSLMNALCQSKNLVRTSATPGCTRQISFFEVRTKDDAQVTLVDLPGYGYAKRSKGERDQWAELIEHYLLSRPTLSAVVALADVRRGLEQEEQDLVDLLRSPPRIRRPGLKIAVALTKLDKLPASSRKLATERAVNGVKGLEVFGVSTELPDTVQRLWRRLRTLTDLGPRAEADSV